MKDLTQTTCHSTNNNALNGFEICLDFVDYHMTFHVMYSLKMQIAEKLIMLRPLLVKMSFIAIF